MNFFDGLAFIFEDSPRANKMRRLCQAKLVVQDAWLEAGGCEICRGFGKLLDGRRCEHEFDLGIDPMLSYQEIIHRLTHTGDSLGTVIAFPRFEIQRGLAQTGNFRVYTTIRPKMLLLTGNAKDVYVTGLFFGASSQIAASMSNPVDLETYAGKIWTYDLVHGGLDISLQLENRSNEHRSFNVALAGEIEVPRHVVGIGHSTNSGRGLSWDEIEELNGGAEPQPRRRGSRLRAQ